MTRTTAFILTLILALTAAITSNGGNFSPSLSAVVASASFLSTTGTGKTYYVANTGSDANSCAKAQNQSTSKLTIASGLACLSSGDWLEIKAGTYNERIQSNTNLFTNQSGTSWNNATTIEAYGSDSVTVTGGISINSPVGGTEYQYIVIRNLILDGNGIALGGGGNGGTVHHIKVDGIEIKNVSNSGIFLGGADHSGSDLWVTNTKVHDYEGSPSNQFHCWYIEGSRNLIEYSECYNWSGGYGIHNYTQGGKASDNIYRYNWIHDVGNTASTVFGLLLTVGDNNRAYGNLITNNSNGVNIDSGTGNMAYNNTIYGNGVGTPCGIIFCYNAVEIANSSSNTVFKNNTIFANKINGLNNKGTDSSISNNLTVDPQFVNPSGGDFSVQSISPAINAGTSNITTEITILAPAVGAFQYK